MPVICRRSALKCDSAVVIDQSYARKFGRSCGVDSTGYARVAVSARTVIDDEIFTTIAELESAYYVRVSISFRLRPIYLVVLFHWRDIE